MNVSAVFLAIASAIFISLEVIIYKHIQNKYESTNGDLVMWIYRVGSLFFISLFILWQLFKKEKNYCRTALATLNMRDIVWWLVLMSLLSAGAVVCYYRAVNLSDNPGLPTAVRSIYIPLTFFLSIILITRDWKKENRYSYVGMAVLILGVIIIIYGTVTGSGNEDI